MTTRVHNGLGYMSEVGEVSDGDSVMSATDQVETSVTSL